jgi:hypothetical protein
VSFKNIKVPFWRPGQRGGIESDLSVPVTDMIKNAQPTGLQLKQSRNWYVIMRPIR